MPRGDRRGPEGLGPRTGRGLGYCNGYDTPGFTKGTPRGGAGFGGGFGRGRGMGYGRGNGWRSGYVQPVAAPYTAPVSYSKEDELRLLKDQSEQMKRDLDSVNQRIEELENE